MEYYVSDPPGPYGVGVKHVVVKGKTTPPVCIFYPIKREEYEENVDDVNKTTSYMLDPEECQKSRVNGMDQVKQVSTASSFMKAMIPSHAPMIIRMLDDEGLFRIRAIIDGELHKDFKTEGKKLTPVILCSGLGSYRGHFTYLSSHLASFGCIVYTFNFTDRSH